jgi:hypothetical protein
VRRHPERSEGSGRRSAILAAPLLTSLLCCPAALTAQDYSLFHKTPRAEARPLATDRPDRTENARSIPAGWVQVEANVVAWSRDREAGAATRDLGVAQLNLKVGLLPDVDLQLVTEVWSRQTVHGRDGALLASASGQGLVMGRLKMNLWGNDGGRTALAIMPFAGAVRQDATPGVRVGRHAVAGIIVPFAVQLGRDWSLGAQLELDLANDVPGAWRSTWVQSLTVGRPIAGPLSGFVELFHASGGGAPRELTADGGLTLGLTDDLQLDAGVNVGLTRGADDVNPFLGLAVRF